MKRVGCLVGLLFLWAVSGCGGKLPGLVPAEGELFYNGRPLAWATVTLIDGGDSPGRPAIGFTDERGRFTLLTLGENGAFPGTYTARITKNIMIEGPDSFRHWLEDHEQGLEEPRPEEKVADVMSVIPPEYQDAQTSGLTVEIGKKGDRSIRLELDANGFQPVVPKAGTVSEGADEYTDSI